MKNMIRPFTHLVLTILAIVVMSTGNCLAAFSGLGEVQQNISSNIAVVPKGIGVLAYVIAAFFTATGIVKLKDWVTDSEKNPINGAVFRLVVAALLVSMPYVIVVVTNSMFGKNDRMASVTSSDAVEVHSFNAF